MLAHDPKDRMGSKMPMLDSVIAREPKGEVLVIQLSVGKPSAST